MKKQSKTSVEFASTGGSAIPVTQWEANMRKHSGQLPGFKNKINIRTDV